MLFRDVCLRFLMLIRFIRVIWSVWLLGLLGLLGLVGILGILESLGLVRLLGLGLLEAFMSTFGNVSFSFSHPPLLPVIVTAVTVTSQSPTC